MPRPKKESGASPKKRSRTGCWPCKARKVKCGEEKPACLTCVKTGELCDYSIKLNWGGRSRNDKDGVGMGTEGGGFTFVTASAGGGDGAATAAGDGSGRRSGRDHVFSAQHIAAAPQKRRTVSREVSNVSTPETTPGMTPQTPPGGDTPLDPQLYATQPYASEHRLPARAGLPHFGASFQGAFPADQRTTPTSAPLDDAFRWSPRHSAKRVKLSPTQHQHVPPSPARSTPHAQLSPALGHAQPSPVFAVPQYPFPGIPPDPSPSSSTHFTPTAQSIGSIVHTPATPGSSINSGCSPYPPQPATLQVQHKDPPDLRRLSVKSLLSEDPDEDFERGTERQNSLAEILEEGHRAAQQPLTTRVSPTEHKRQSSGNVYRTYGYDHGFHDLDIPHNDDHHVVLPRSPDLRRASAAVSEVSTGSEGEGEGKFIAFEPGGYYAQPVPIKIPCFLEPLPEELLANQMNLLYFHHFINHTGRIMVPHDCPENPFRNILPQMAVRNTHLLHLVLAFSASHRARLLAHAEPANRIAEWMSDVLPALREALNNPNDDTSLAPLATAIMLASLEIISPHTFAVPIPWQHHLHVARQLILAKGGLHHLAHTHGPRDKATFFLSRWFAYLDVLGSLSGGSVPGAVGPLGGAYREDGGGLWLVNRADDEIYQIDCFFGFSGRCIALLAQVAELAQECDRERVDPGTGEVRPGWMPGEGVRARAGELGRRLRASAGCVYRGCAHTSSPHHRGRNGDGVAASASSTAEEEEEVDDDLVAREIFATNEAYHWAGLIHLYRRCMGLPRESEEVQGMVRRVVGCLGQVRRGSSAEGCLVWPMFCAGCEALPEEVRRGAREDGEAEVGGGDEGGRVGLGDGGEGKPPEAVVGEPAEGHPTGDELASGPMSATAEAYAGDYGGQATGDRAIFLSRLEAVEGWGMQQVGRARALMQRVWATGRGWESMVEGEFLG